MFDFFISLYVNLERGYHYIVKDFLFVVGIIIVNYTIPRWKKEKQSKVILKSLLYMIGVWLTLILCLSIHQHRNGLCNCVSDCFYPICFCLIEGSMDRETDNGNLFLHPFYLFHSILRYFFIYHSQYKGIC